MGVLLFMRNAQDTAPVIIDPDAADYIARVEAAEGDTMNYGVQTAVDDMFSWVEPNTTMTKADLFKAAYLFAGHQSIAGAKIPFIETAGLGATFNNGTGAYSTVTGVTGSQISTGPGSLDVPVPNGFVSQASACFYVYMTSLGTTIAPGQIQIPFDTDAASFKLIVRADVNPDVLQPRVWRATGVSGETFSDFNLGSSALISSTDPTVTIRTFYKNNLDQEAQHIITGPPNFAPLTSLRLARSPIPVAFVGVGTQIPTAEGAAIRARFDQFIAEVQTAAEAGE